MNIKELQELQAMPLEEKIGKTKMRIFDAIRRFDTDGLYVSFSGGKDSIVLHHIVAEFEMELFGELRIPRVFCDTGLEYPQLVENIKKMFEGSDILQIIKPTKSFLEVLKVYGYPVISKEQSDYIYRCRTSPSESVRNRCLNGTAKGGFKISEKWKYLVDADFRISDKCCYHMKKSPFFRYEKQTGRIPILGTMAEESFRRTQTYIRNGGCNSFDNVERPKSNPIGFWREQDILEYIRLHNLSIPSVYGDIVEEDGKLTTTGVHRTGCVWCLFNAQSKKDNRFTLLKKTNPNLFDYCMRGGKYDEEGLWIPHNGLGFRKVLKDLGKEVEE